MGGGGNFYWESGAAPGTYVDNVGTIIVPTGGDGSAAWLRDYSGATNPLWFGGRTDVTVQAAIDILSASGGLVELPAGSYTFTNTVNLADGVQLLGLAGRDGVRITANGITAISSVNNQQVVVKDLRIYSNRTTDTWGVYVNNNPRGIHIENVYCDGFGDNAAGGGFALITECWGSRLIGLAAERCGYGCYLEAISATTILNPSFRQLAAPGIYWNGGVGNNIIGGVIEKTWGASGAVTGNGYSMVIICKLTKISGVYTEQSIDGLIKIKDSYGVSVDSCFIDGVSGPILDGFVSIENSNHVVVMASQISGLSSSLGTGKSCISIDAASFKVSIITNRLEPDGSTGPGNFVVIDNSTAQDTVYINNSGFGMPTRGIGAEEVLTPILKVNDIYNPTNSDSISFFTRSAGTYIERLVLEFLGNLRSSTDNSRTLGTSAFRWSNVYGTNYRPGAGTAIWTSGTGTPEGVVSAVVGSLYTDTAGGAGTTLYVKETGTGNTGWVAK